MSNDEQLRAVLLGGSVDTALLLKLAQDEDLAALLEGLRANLRQSPPGLDVNEHNGLLLLRFASMVDRNDEGAERDALRRVAELRIASQVAQENDVVETGHGCDLCGGREEGSPLAPFPSGIKILNVAVEGAEHANPSPRT